MPISDYFNETKNKYDPKTNIIDEWNNETRHYTPSKYCRNALALSLGKCQTCGYCGREFDSSGKLIGSEIEEADEQIFTATNER